MQRKNSSTVSRRTILATLVYVQDGEKTLMLHRVKKENDYHAGKWNGLGGKFEPGESPEACAIREVAEESGLQIKNPELCGHILFHYCPVKSPIKTIGCRMTPLKVGSWLA
ncbi:MAG: NUDIX domain-containing protein [Lentisphaeria bacterium]|nr:NUDIX domain-containing protein [Candidatus Neomarinimicrobiota bacterium]MCF7842449.1 NUDIX domain-containing protein [Lentisphaeria bacterium]